MKISRSVMAFIDPHVRVNPDVCVMKFLSAQKMLLDYSITMMLLSPLGNGGHYPYDTKLEILIRAPNLRIFLVWFNNWES